MGPNIEALWILDTDRTWVMILKPQVFLQICQKVLKNNGETGTFVKENGELTGDNYIVRG